MGTKGPKAGNIFTSLRSRGLVGGQGQDPSIKGMGSPFKQTQPNGDGKDGSLFGSFARGIDKVTRGGVNVINKAAKIHGDFSKGIYDKLTTGFGNGNRHMDGPAPSQPSKPNKQSYSASKSKNSKAVLESELKGDEAINDPMKKKATPFKKCGCGKKKCNC